MVANGLPANSPVNLSKILLVVCIPVFVVMLDASILFVAFPAIKSTYADVSLANLSWILNAYTIALGAQLIPSGALADRYGRKRIFLLGMAVFVTGSVLCGISQSVWFLIFGRVIQGSGSALLVPTSLAIVLAEFSKEKRPMAIAAWGATGALAAAIGPSVGSLIIQFLGWRWAFFINVPIGVWCLVLATKYIPRMISNAQARLPSAVGVGLVVLSTALISLALVEGRDWGWDSTRIQVALGVGLLLFIAFVLQNASSSRPVIDVTLFRSRNFTFGNLTTFTFSITFTGMLLSYVLFLRQVWHYSIVQTGFALTVAPLIVVPSALLTGKFASRHGHSKAILVGGLLSAMAFGFRALTVTAEPNFLALWVPAALIGGIGGGMLLPSLSAAATHDLPPNRYAVGSGVNSSIRQLGSVLGVAVTVACVNVDVPRLAAAFGTLFWSLTGLSVLTAILGTVVRTSPVAGTSGAVSESKTVTPGEEVS